MSYLIFGQLNSTREINLQKLDTALREIEVVASAHAVELKFDREAWHPKLLEYILDKLPSAQPDSVPFLLVAPPDFDHSEGVLFRPVSLLASKESREFLWAGLKGIERIFTKLLERKICSSIDSIWSNNYDIADPVYTCGPTNMPSLAYELLRLKSYYASFRLEVVL